MTNYKVGTTTYTDCSPLEFTLLDSNGDPKTVDVTSVQSGDGRYANLTVEFTLPSGYTSEDYDFLVNIEARAYRNDSGHVGEPETTVKTSVSCPNVDTNITAEVALRCEHADYFDFNSYNALGAVRRTWRAGLTPFGAANPREVHITVSAAHAFVMKYDLVQIVPVPKSPRYIVKANCDPAIASTNTSSAPQTVSAQVFDQSHDGFKLVWDNAIWRDDSNLENSNGNPGGRTFPIRVYFITGDPRHPFEDVTCAMLEVFDEPTRSVTIKFKPPAAATAFPLPKGLYAFCTGDQTPELGHMCAAVIHSDLRSAKFSEYIGEPLVRDEIIWVYSQPTGTSSNAPAVEEDCQRGTCTADCDDGTGTGTPDDGVGIEDLLYYLNIYDLGWICADTDDGSETGTRDEGVGIEDLLYFLVRYDAGC